MTFSNNPTLHPVFEATVSTPFFWIICTVLGAWAIAEWSFRK